MPEFKFACGERLPGSTHDRRCYATHGHAGHHACYMRHSLGRGRRDQRQEGTAPSERRVLRTSLPAVDRATVRRPGVRMIRIVYHPIDRTI